MQTVKKVIENYKYINEKGVQTPVTASDKKCKSTESPISTPSCSCPDNTSWQTVSHPDTTPVIYGCKKDKKVTENYVNSTGILTPENNLNPTCVSTTSSTSNCICPNGTFWQPVNDINVTLTNIYGCK